MSYCGVRQCIPDVGNTTMRLTAARLQPGHATTQKTKQPKMRKKESPGSGLSTPNA